MINSPNWRVKPRPRRRSVRQQNAARMAAVQALYQIEITSELASNVIKEFEAYRIDGKDLEIAGGAKANNALFSEIVNEVNLESDQIDTKLSPFMLSNRSIESLEIILRCILRAGFYELNRRIQVPARSIIQEYVWIANAFYSGDQPGFVNGVLDKVTRNLRPGELETLRSVSER